MTFERLHDITVLKVRYTTLSALAISAGDQPSEIMESPVIKLGGKPVIPGSSLKGALRSTLEAMLAGLGHKVCIPFAAIPRRYRRKEEQQAYVARLGRLTPCDNIEHPCPVCSIFGTVGGQAGLSGKALFLDATVRGEYELIERSHVAITRDTRSQSEGSLMSLQAVDAGATFRGEIRVVNPEPWEVGAILRALEGTEFLGMGAKKTAGYGNLEIEVEQIEVVRFDGQDWRPTPAELKPYLEAFAQKFGA
jgi:CRISPR-associated RAMP protein (TIGR02581 family)